MFRAQDLSNGTGKKRAMSKEEMGDMFVKWSAAKLKDCLLWNLNCSSKLHPRTGLANVVGSNELQTAWTARKGPGC